jgi:hypothetical protein
LKKPTEADGLFFLDELVLRGSTNRANPIVGQFLESCSRFDAVFRVANSRIVNVAAKSAFPLVHVESSSLAARF